MLFVNIFKKKVTNLSHHDTNNRLDEIGRNLTAIEADRIAMTLIDQISDPQKRDDAIQELAKDLRTRKVATDG